MSGQVITTAAYAELMVPIMRTIYNRKYQEKPAVYPKVFRTIEGEKMKYQEDLILAEMGFLQRTPAGDAQAYDAPSVVGVQKYETYHYRLAAAITREARDDNRHFKMGADIAAQLADANKRTKEAESAKLFNYAFGTTNVDNPLRDGKALLATDHPLANGDTFANKLGTPADLSMTSLEAVLTLIQNAKTERGHPAMIKPTALLTSTSTITWTARKILGSPLRPNVKGNQEAYGDTFAWNDPNLISQDADTLFPKGHIAWNYLTDDDAWFVLTDVERGLLFINRVDGDDSMQGDFDTDNLKYAIYSRFGVGVGDARAVYGCEGA